ncbi:MAG: dienelactone hydrolase family protein, partial [Fidelibacterota bacterium]
MKLGVLLVAALVLAVLNRPMRRVWKLVVVLANLAPGPLTPLINRLSPRVTGETGQIATGKGEQYPLKIYHPPSSRASPAVILYPGATSAGEEHEVVNRVGRSLARIGLRTFLPGLPRLKEAKVEERTVEEMVDVFESVTGRGDVDPDRVVVAGMSFGGSLLVKASMDDRMRGKPAAVLSYGSYFDLERALEFALSGDFTDDTHHYHFQPDAWGRIVFFHNFLDEVDGDFDRDNVRSYFGTYVEQGEAEAVSVYDGFPERDRNFIDGIMRGSGGEGLTVARQVLPGIKNT